MSSKTRRQGHYSRWGRPKVRHATEELAVIAAARMSEDRGSLYTPYVCGWLSCQAWHIGEAALAPGVNRDDGFGHSSHWWHEIGERAAGNMRAENHGSKLKRIHAVSKRAESARRKALFRQASTRRRRYLP